MVEGILEGKAGAESLHIATLKPAVATEQMSARYANRYIRLLIAE